MKELKKETIKKLKELRDNFTYDTNTDYTNIINIMIDYDNEAQDNLYLYDKCKEMLEVVDDEMLQYIIQNDGCYRLFHLTNGLEYCIDEAIEMLKGDE